MSEIAPLLLRRSTHRQNMIGPDETTRDGCKYGAGWLLNEHTDGVSRHLDTDPNAAVKHAEELQLRQAANTVVSQAASIGPLSCIFAAQGRDFEQLMGSQNAAMVTESIETAMHHECLITCKGFASAPTKHHVWRDYAVVSWAEVHSDTCNAGHSACDASGSRTCLEGGGHFFIGGCKVVCETGVTILYRYIYKYNSYHLLFNSLLCSAAAIV
jgi:hypothetical protein